MHVSDSHESKRSAIWHENLETKLYTASLNVPKVARVWRQYVKLSTQSSRLNILSRYVSHRQQENSIKEYSPSSEILQCNYKSVIQYSGLPSGLAHLKWTDDFNLFFNLHSRSMPYPSILLFLPDKWGNDPINGFLEKLSDGTVLALQSMLQIQ